MEISEQNVVSELKRRNPYALEFVMDHYGGLVYGLIQRILEGIAGKEDMEECCSDAFVAAWERAEEYDSAKGSLKTWLLILAKYKALDYRRKLQKRVETVTLQLEPASPSGVEDIFLSREESLETINAIARLPEPDRSMFCKRYIYYETLDHIAAEFGLTKKAVENRLYRCRTTLKQSLAHVLKGG